MASVMGLDGITVAEALKGAERMVRVLRGAKDPDGTMRCWQCGAEPLEIYEITTLGAAQPTYIAGRWPSGDHEHAERPPTPGELEQAGYEALKRILGTG